MSADERNRIEHDEARNFRRRAIELPDGKTGTVLSLVPRFSRADPQIYVVQVTGEWWVRHEEEPV